METQSIRSRFGAGLSMESSTQARQRSLRTQQVASPARTTPGSGIELLRAFLAIVWFLGCCIIINLTQFIGCPLYFINRDYYYAYMTLTKQSFGLVITAFTQWFAPTKIRVSGEPAVARQLRKTADGRLECDFPERLVLIANHQLYTDWIYLWWIAYAAGRHGHIYILLKQSLRYIPIVGPGMMFFGFIFLARSWAQDQARIAHRLRKLTARHEGPLSGSQGLDPMWLLIFPEGTNLSANTRRKSAAWAAKKGVKDLRHELIPRITGLQFSLRELRGTLDWVYDCTVAYEGIPPGQYGQDLFTLRSMYFQGRPPKSVNMHWRRFPMAEIPLDDSASFEEWLMRVWREKDDLLEYFRTHGHFPGAEEADNPEAGQETRAEKTREDKAGTEQAEAVETQVQLGHWTEVGQIFMVLAIIAGVLGTIQRVWLSLFRRLSIR